MRLFIALDCSAVAPYQKELQEQLKPFLRGSFSKDAHLTLKFLGDVADSKVEHVTTQLQAVTVKPFQLRLSRLGFFPSEKYIRVIWLGVEPHEPVVELQKRVDEVFQKDFSKEKDFVPHLTLARVKHIPDRTAFLEKVQQLKIEPQAITVNKIHLMKSVLTPQGAEYSVVATFS